ncbi:hypothetical protein SCLARK_00668 [Spiroplasma clarkii]|uniref:Lipoprotein n=1 Tax=Spiroplasma clarkii TaxID=2139 RepID=A0A1Y0L027_9MOLU|nr:lipoprotein [Spiroplasma clarkii]ARU91331.1 hypothetical protein SCLARK_00668 [Spiroplasma clarkii]ATX70753.1 hypothetical protein SCLAR_v1c04290 [Spiroplasma clarkii]
MKKLLSLFGAIGMVATASTSVIACTNTEGSSLPKNPSTKEEIIALINNNVKDLVAKMDEINDEVMAILDEYEDWEGDEPIFIVPAFKEKQVMQDALIGLLSQYAFSAKVAQYICTLDVADQKTFFGEHKVNLEKISFVIIFPEIKLANGILQEKVNTFVTSLFDDDFEDIASATDKTKEQFKKIAAWVMENKFSTSS